MCRRSFPFRSVLLAVLVVLLWAASARGLTCTWTGDGGAATDAAHWTNCGGGIPNSASDDCVFDASSFTIGAQTVTALCGLCRAMDWTGVTNNPTWNYSSGSVTCSGHAGTSCCTAAQGSLTLAAGMTLVPGTKIFGLNCQAGGGCALDTAGQTIAGFGAYFGGAQTVTLASDLTVDVTNGGEVDVAAPFATANHTMTAGQIIFNYAGTTLSSLGSSAITVSGDSCNVTSFGGTTFFDAGTSHIFLNCAVGGSLQDDPSTVYYDLRFFSGPASTVLWSNLDPSSAHDVTIDPGASIRVVASTVTVNSLTCAGTGGNHITLTGYLATKALNSASTVACAYTDVTDLACTGVTPCYTGAGGSANAYSLAHGWVVGDAPTSPTPGGLTPTVTPTPLSTETPTITQTATPCVIHTPQVIYEGSIAAPQTSPHNIVASNAEVPACHVVEIAVGWRNPQCVGGFSGTGGCSLQCSTGGSITDNAGNIYVPAGGSLAGTFGPSGCLAVAGQGPCDCCWEDTDDGCGLRHCMEAFGLVQFVGKLTQPLPANATFTIPIVVGTGSELISVIDLGPEPGFPWEHSPSESDDALSYTFCNVNGESSILNGNPLQPISNACESGACAENGAYFGRIRTTLTSVPAGDLILGAVHSGTPFTPTLGSTVLGTVTSGNSLTTLYQIQQATGVWSQGGAGAQTKWSGESLLMHPACSACEAFPTLLPTDIPTPTPTATTIFRQCVTATPVPRTPRQCVTVTPVASAATATPSATPTPTPTGPCPYDFHTNTGGIGRTCLYNGNYSTGCLAATVPTDAYFAGDGQRVSIILSTQPVVTWTGVATSATTARLQGYQVGTLPTRVFAAGAQLVGGGAVLQIDADLVDSLLTPFPTPPYGMCAFPQGCAPGSEDCPFSFYDGAFVKVITGTSPPPVRYVAPVPWSAVPK